MKIISFYLPQFHSIPENDEFWGEGFTEWTNVKKAIPLFEGHKQPVEPLNDYYYSLLDVETLKWQSELAKEYGLYGFCFYHYWIEGRKLLEKPVELYLKNKDIETKYCLSWANHSWTDSWSTGNKVLIAQTYGNIDDWNNHYDYLRSFFEDERYIKIEGKPLFIIYMPETIPNLNEMLDYWNERAKKDGFGGLVYAYQYIYYDMKKKKDDSRFKYGIEFQPAYAIADSRGKMMANFRRIIFVILSRIQELINIRIDMNKTSLEVMDYSKIWEWVIKRKPNNNKKIPGAFSGWDNTPRKGKAGLVLHNSSPQVFKKYMKIQIKRTKEIYKKDMLFLTAWNEWAEGSIMEPTKADKYGYLEALKEALIETNEWEQ